MTESDAHLISQLEDAERRARALRNGHQPRGNRGWFRTFALALIPSIAICACYSVGILLSRIDAAQAEARTATASAANAYAHVLALRAEVDKLRVPPVAVDQLCRDRVEALRDGLRVMMRVGRVELEDFPGMRWRNWE